MTTLPDSSPLRLNGKATLLELPSSLSVEAVGESAAFLHLSLPEARSYTQIPLGRIAGLRRFTVTHRYEPFWMRPAAGERHGQIPAETQWLLAETDEDDYVMLVPLLSADARFALQGGADRVELVLETGDPFTPSTGGLAMFVARGEQPYELMESGARAVAARLGSIPLRRAKPVPDFVDWFGWCTWDAFYQDVDAAALRRGLESFRDGGVNPRFLILDDGWQSTRKLPTGESRLTAFAANEKFGGDLRPVVQLAKASFDVRCFLVWHAIIGYWGGVDGMAMKDFAVIDQARSFGVGVLKHEPHMNHQWWGQLAGLVAPADIARFYDEYHRALAAQGIDGVKVDTQAMLEGLALRQGGRVALNRTYRQALEDAVTRHFGGRLINCMSHAMETFYGSPRSTLIRSSTDFWPRRPETHGLHLYTNAQVGVWFGEFMQPDWDMFQSGHPWGAYHAAGRAVSGGPVYVSDKPGVHDFELLRKLVCSDGTVLRADAPGRPTLDCLLADPTRQDVLLKIFNRNGRCGVLGVFHAQYHPDGDTPRALRGTHSPRDVIGFTGTDFAALAHTSGAIWRTAETQQTPIELPEGGWEIVSYSPIRDGFAPLGLADKLNSTGAIVSDVSVDQARAITLRDGGKFVAWSARRPGGVTVDGTEVAFDYDAASGALRVSLPQTGRQTVHVRLT